MNTAICQINKAFAYLIELGKVAYSPIVCNHHILRDFDMPQDKYFWRKYNKALIRGAGALYILTLHNWTVSDIVCSALEEASLERVPVYLLDYQTYDITEYKY